MLVFTRTKDQQIVIDDNIVVTVVAVRGDRVRLGIEAPRDVSVYRSELAAAKPQVSDPPETKPL